MGEGRNTMHLLRDIARTFARVQRQAFRCCGPASETQCLVLTALGPGEAVSVSELAARVGTDLAWTSRTVEQLHRAGDVTRREDPADRRLALVELSASGKARAQALQEALDAHAEAILQRIPAARRARILEDLDLLLTALRETELETGASVADA